jgi:O-antigen/teichoic acid export membrane protein
VAWALAGNIGYSACQWGILVCIAKLGSATDVGRFGLGLALTAPIITLTNLHLRILQATDAREDYPFGVYFALRLVSTAVALAAIAVIALALGYRGATFCLILAVAVAKAFEALSDVVFGLLQKAETLRRVAASMLAKGVLSIVAMVVGLRLTGSIVVGTTAMAVVWGGLLALYDLPAAARLASIRPILVPRTLAQLAWLALPVGLVAALGSLTTNVPRYAIEAKLGATALGHFVALAYLFVAGSQPILALGAATNARLARHFYTNPASYRRLTWRTILIAAGLGVVAVVGSALFGRPLLTLAYAPEYAEQAPLLVWLAVAAGFGFIASTLGFAVTAARRLAEQLPIACLNLAVCAVASHLLVPRYGLLGAAWAVLAAEATRLLCLAGVYAASSASSLRRATELAVCGAVDEAPTAG